MGEEYVEAQALVDGVHLPLDTGISLICLMIKTTMYNEICMSNPSSETFFEDPSSRGIPLLTSRDGNKGIYMLDTHARQAR